MVAAKPLRFGNEVTADSLREVSWPEGSLTSGTFAKISDIIGGGKRVALSAIEPDEPLLSSKITGSGQRATLSAMIRDGLKAVTVRVNDVEGVGGFVLPGDHVDVSLTRQVDKENATSEVVLQNVRVLGIDQMADERLEQALGGQGGDARGRRGGRAEAVARSLGRHLVADAAQGRRGRSRVFAPHHAERSQRTEHAGGEGPQEFDDGHGRGAPRRRRREEYSVPIEGINLARRRWGPVTAEAGRRGRSKNMGGVMSADSGAMLRAASKWRSRCSQPRCSRPAGR